MQNKPSQISSVDSNQILEDLTRRQFLTPHTSLAEALDGSSNALGFCARATSHALHWLELNPEQRLGRLRRTELTQLARSIHRFWKHALALETPNSAQ